MKNSRLILCILCEDAEATTAVHFFKADIFRDMFPNGKGPLHSFDDQNELPEPFLNVSRQTPAELSPHQERPLRAWL